MGDGDAPKPIPPLGTGAPPSLSKRAIFSLRRLPVCSDGERCKLGDGDEDRDDPLPGGVSPLLACSAAMRSLSVDLVMARSKLDDHSMG